MNQKRPKVKQQTPQELLDTLLDFIRRKFYETDPVNFAKDRRRLLDWVVLWPASWLEERGVTVPADQYREIFFNVFLEAKALGTDKIKYRPAWLAQVIQSHFDHNGEKIYEKAKSMRNLVENAMLMTGKLAAAVPDPVRELHLARRLIASPAKKTCQKQTTAQSEPMLPGL